MPNWCHSTLTVAGPKEEISRFVESARPSEELIRNWWEKSKANEWSPETRSFEEYLAAIRETQPLSFDCLVPQPSAEEYEAMDAARKTAKCRLCAGMGKRPTTEEEAEAWGIRFYKTDLPDVPFDDRKKCNGCQGTGKTFPEGESESWYMWRLANWGTKWDASFNGSSMIALGAETMDPELTMSTRGATVTPEVVVYKFDTAWSPPSPVVEKTSENFPELEFRLRYGEMGADYAGEEVFQAGICISCEELTVDEVLAPEEQWF